MGTLAVTAWCPEAATSNSRCPGCSSTSWSRPCSPCSLPISWSSASKFCSEPGWQAMRPEHRSPIRTGPPLLRRRFSRITRPARKSSRTAVLVAATHQSHASGNAIAHNGRAAHRPRPPFGCGGAALRFSAYVAVYTDRSGHRGRPGYGLFVRARSVIPPISPGEDAHGPTLRHIYAVLVGLSHLPSCKSPSRHLGWPSPSPSPGAMSTPLVLLIIKAGLFLAAPDLQISSCPAHPLPALLRRGSKS